MRPGRAPDYQLIRAVGDLPAGAFVRPIEMKWVPKETIERLGIDKMFLDENEYVVCYARFGMVLIERANIREV